MVLHYCRLTPQTMVLPILCVIGTNRRRAHRRNRPVPVPAARVELAAQAGSVAPASST